MPTNDERRAVAARLRWLTMAYKDVFGVYVLNAIGLDFTNSRGTYCSNDSVRRLADLIEPEERTCRNAAKKTDREFGNPFVCSECGADPHDAESYYCGFSSGEYDWRFCPNCGARVIQE